MGNAFQKKTDIPEQFLRPQGLYPRCDWDERTVRKMIINKHLAPCYPGKEETEHLGEDRDWTLEECPICMLSYPGGLNRCGCCTQPICTECYLQIKKPKHGTATCPFCNATNYAAQYKGPKSQKQIEEEQIEQQRVVELQLKAQREEAQAQIEREEHRRAAASSSSLENSHQESFDLCSEQLAQTENNQPDQESGLGTETQNEERHSPTGNEHLRDYIPQEAPEGMNADEVDEWMLNQAIQMSLAQENTQDSPESEPTQQQPTSPRSEMDEQVMLALALSMSVSDNRES